MTQTDKTTKKVLVFGTFDLIHDGHRHFLVEAKKLGHLTAVVASDIVVQKLKGQLPHHSLTKRIDNLKLEKLADEIIAGENVIKSWDAIRDQKPDIVAIGYDQIELKLALEDYIRRQKLEIKCATITPFKDRTLHSSRLRKKL